MNGFGRQILAEWTKLRTVRRWVLALAGVVLLTVMLSAFAASGSRTDANQDPTLVAGPDGGPVTDGFFFAHQRAAGDVTITTRVAEQADSNEWATAGLMIKDGLTPGSRYAAVAVTPHHGTRLMADFSVDREAGAGSWLRLSRHGGTVTAAWSTDGRTWQQSALPSDLPPTVEIGLFVGSPGARVLERDVGSTSLGEQPTDGRAVFDNVTLGGGRPDLRGDPVGTGRGDLTESWGGGYTVTGSGRIGPAAPPDDMLQVTLFGLLAGVLVLVAVGALFMTSEFKRGLVRTTLTASPRRGRMLAAKAVVLAGVAFVLGLVAGVLAFLTAQPVLRDRGWTPPAFPVAAVTDPPVVRVLVMTALFVAAVALLALGVATITRHSAATIGAVVALVVLPQVVGWALPAGAARVLMLLTPAGGFATLRAKPPTDALVDPTAMISGWQGLTVAVLWAAAALTGGWYLLRRRDA